MGTWGLFVLYDLSLLLTVRLVHFAVDAESSWSRAVVRAVRRCARHVRRRFARPRGRPIEVIADEVRHLGHDLRAPHAPGDGQAAVLRSSYDSVLAEACTALDVVHLLGVLEPGPDRDLERDRVVRRLTMAGLCLEETG